MVKHFSFLKWWGLRFREGQRGAFNRQDQDDASPLDLGTLQVFVMKRPWPSVLFGWEIRLSGTLVVARSRTGYSVQKLARGAGERALGQRELRA